MGYELQARVVPPIEPAALRKALEDKFASLRWTVVRADKNTLSVAYANRVDTGWDDDFTVGVGETLMDAVNRASGTGHSAAMGTAQTIVYLVVHLGSCDVWGSLVPLIDEVIAQRGGTAEWEAW